MCLHGSGPASPDWDCLAPGTRLSPIWPQYLRLTQPKWDEGPQVIIVGLGAMFSGIRQGVETLASLDVSSLWAGTESYTDYQCSYSQELTCSSAACLC